MQIIRDWLYKRRQAKILRTAKLLCEHMSYIYHYYYKSYPLDNKGRFINEAMVLLHGWKRTSANVYTYKKTGVSMEIKKDADLASVTKRIFTSELPTLVWTKSGLEIRRLEKDGFFFIEDFFMKNPYI
jgi:hypothetical protein